MENYAIPLEVRPYKCVGIIGTYRKRSISGVKLLLKRMGFKPFCILDIGHPSLIGVLLGGAIEMTIFQMTEIWTTSFGIASLKHFKCGQPVHKQLTNCGYPVNSYKVLEDVHGVLGRDFRKSS